MRPELLMAVFPFHRFARKRLLFADLFEMQLARPVQAMIPHKHRLATGPVLPERNHREIFYVEIDADGNQLRILLALDDLFRLDAFRLRKMQLSRSLAQHQFGALLFPGGFLDARLEEA